MRAPSRDAVFFSVALRRRWRCLLLRATDFGEPLMWRSLFGVLLLGALCGLAFPPAVLILLRGACWGAPSVRLPYRELLEFPLYCLSAPQVSVYWEAALQTHLSSKSSLRPRNPIGTEIVIVVPISGVYS